MGPLVSTEMHLLRLLLLLLPLLRREMEGGREGMLALAQRWCESERQAGTGGDSWRRFPGELWPISMSRSCERVKEISSSVVCSICSSPNIETKRTLL
jgi:hypothetical protein